MSKSTKSVVITDAFNQLEQFRQLEPNWDSYGGCRITDSAIRVAQKMVLEVQNLLSKQEEDERHGLSVLVPLSDGGIQIEWCVRDSELGVEIHPDGQLGFLFLEGIDGKRFFSEKDTATLSDVITCIRCMLKCDNKGANQNERI